MMMMVDAMKARVGSPARKLVLIKLADHANDDGECWPSIAHIADHCEMSRSSVKHHIRELEKARLLERYGRSGTKGSASNVYILRLSGDANHSAPGQDSTPDQDSTPGQNLTTPRSDLDPPPVKSCPPPGQNLTPESVIEPISEPVTETSSDSRESSGDEKPGRQVGKASAGHKWTDQDRQLAQAMLDRVRTVAPSAKGSKRWPNDIRLMRERDGHSHAEIWDLFAWANADSFWAANILSPAKLRDKWPQLEAQRARKSGASSPNDDAFAKASQLLQGGV